MSLFGACYRSVPERAFKITIYSKLSLDLLPLWSRFWEFRANHLKSRLHLNHVLVHETHSAKVRQIPMSSTTPSLNRMVSLSEPSLEGLWRRRSTDLSTCRRMLKAWLIIMVYAPKFKYRVSSSTFWGEKGLRCRVLG
jgi:hypothetical protein